MDPRDPDYDEPPAGIDEEPAPQLEGLDDYEEGPRNYTPARTDV